jgi:site-specific DNA-methyltransferase (adenine-specific)
MKLINWDCLEEMKKMESESVDMILTSPPYDNLRTYNWSLNWNFEIFSEIAKECARVIKKWWVIVWVVWDATIKWSETGTSFRQALYFKELWLNIHDTMIYRKINHLPLTHNRQDQCFEYMFVFSKWKPKTFNPRTKPNARAWEKVSWTIRKDKENLVSMTWKIRPETSYLPNIWEYIIWWRNSYKEDFVRWHPAVFPEKLAEDHILSWSNEWDVILDPFMWSWTTWKMAKLNNRDFIGIEMVEEYFEIAKNRIFNN